ncbi:MAG: phosphatidate cytidylyltransferase [Cellulosilyticaceae bacterium]
MLTRILTGVIGIPIVIAIVMLGNPVFQYVTMVMALIGVYEFYKVLGKKYKPLKIVGYLATAIYFIFLQPLFYQYYAIFLVVFLGVLLVTMVLTYPKYSIVDVGITLMAPIYVGLMMSFIVILRDFENGNFLVWLIFISAWGSDTCAYFTGKLCNTFFKTHKLAPVLSPKKTIEGSVGGAVGAALIATIYTLIYTQFALPMMQEKLFIIIIIVFIAAILSQIGDLAASAIKRMLEEKDFGFIFPGHGGVLDRFDSVLIVGPVIVIAVMLLF